MRTHGIIGWNLASVFLSFLEGYSMTPSNTASLRVLPTTYLVSQPKTDTLSHLWWDHMAGCGPPHLGSATRRRYLLTPMRQAPARERQGFGTIAGASWCSLLSTVVSRNSFRFFLASPWADPCLVQISRLSSLHGPCHTSSLRSEPRTQPAFRSSFRAWHPHGAVPGFVCSLLSCGWTHCGQRDWPFLPPVPGMEWTPVNVRWLRFRRYGRTVSTSEDVSQVLISVWNECSEKWMSATRYL